MTSIYCLDLTIEPDTLRDGRPAWQLVARWTEPDGRLAAQRWWGPYARLTDDGTGRNNLASNEERFLAGLADGPDWEELDYEDGCTLAQIVALTRYAPDAYWQTATGR